MVQKECLEESTKKEIVNTIDANIRLVRLKSNELSKDLAEGRQTTKDMRSTIRELNAYMCRTEMLKRDIENISACK